MYGGLAMLETLQQSLFQASAEELTELSAGSLVKIFQLRELPSQDLASKVRSQDYGKNTSDSFAIFDPNSLSLKTPQTSFVADSMKYSMILPRSGTMRNGKCYQRVSLVSHIHAKDCSLWRTPMASDAMCLAMRISLDKLRKHLAKSHKTNRAGYQFWLKFKAKPSPMFYEWLMGVCPNWTKIE